MSSEREQENPPSSPKHFNQTMAPLAIESATSAQEMLDLEKNGHAERAQWVLNPPEPPSLWRELKDCMRETLLPQCSNFLSSRNQTGFKTVISVLQAMFPILTWSRNYKATKFKNDVLAGLTLASLCIPQVNTSFPASSSSHICCPFYFSGFLQFM